MNELKNLLKWYEEMGVDTPVSESAIDRTKPIIQPSIFQSNELKQITTSKSASRQLADDCNTLLELEQAVKSFDGCEIKAGAINTVFGEGNPNADIMLIGEAPGASEDERGIPFCGASGKLLDNILIAIGLARKDIYITNTVFWRPPGNRRPTTQEISICRPFVEKHVALIKPKLIVLVGNTSVEALLDVKVSMHSLRGRYFDYTNQYLQTPIKTAVIFHPAYLLRQSLKKKDVWFDMLQIKRTFLS